ncbi:hypothetical protein ACS126_03580 [Sphingobacterium lactis]|uniref:hypothetical protein n=1 Tax=Sphingobacterium TaxID=28453 RepID=UPI0021A68395|nr:hypothetical protein [Sphingobacterium hotanense]MCT1526072.1 hypothetical protein [Sphingobacterium hotanense]
MSTENTNRNHSFVPIPKETMNSFILSSVNDDSLDPNAEISIAFFHSSNNPWLSPKGRFRLSVFFDQLAISRYRSVIKPFD